MTKITEKDDLGNVTKIVEYAYDPLGRRISKHIDNNGDGDTLDAGDDVDLFFYDGQHIALKTDESGNAENRYLHGPAIDMILADEDATGEVLWAATDHLGSVTHLLDFDGTSDTDVVATFTYDAFGKVVDQTGTGVQFIYGYTGREVDAESDEQYNRARYYDADIGRWLSQDPISFAAGDENLYRYVFNFSTGLTDPSGMAPPGLLVEGPDGQWWNVDALDRHLNPSSQEVTRRLAYKSYDSHESWHRLAAHVARTLTNDFYEGKDAFDTAVKHMVNDVYERQQLELSDKVRVERVIRPKFQAQVDEYYREYTGQDANPAVEARYAAGKGSELGTDLAGVVTGRMLSKGICPPTNKSSAVPTRPVPRGNDSTGESGPRTTAPKQTTSSPDSPNDTFGPKSAGAAQAKSVAPRDIGGKRPPSAAGRGIPSSGRKRPKWGDAPGTGGLRGHASKHGDGTDVPYDPNEYYQQAVSNMNHGRKFTYRHSGQTKNAYVKDLGNGNFLFTGTSKNNKTIFTHLLCKERYLNNIGITLRQ